MTATRGAADALDTIRPLRRCHRLVLTAIWIGLAACAPTRPVRTHPAYIAAAVAIGDSVRVETRDGDVMRFRVAGVADDEIVGANGERVLIADIESLSVRSWSRVNQPCGEGRSMGCSVPLPVAVISVFHDHYRVRFEQACIQHDFCYRHGLATYGYDRADCDERFLTDMEAECETGRFGTDVLVGGADLLSRGEVCRSAARQFYDAVRAYGEQAFRREESTVCRYQ
jgi:hypothetical protein